MRQMSKPDQSHPSAFPRRWFAESCTKRFRGNVWRNCVRLPGGLPADSMLSMIWVAVRHDFAWSSRARERLGALALSRTGLVVRQAGILPEDRCLAEEMAPETSAFISVRHKVSAVIRAPAGPAVTRTPLVAPVPLSWRCGKTQNGTAQAPHSFRQIRTWVSRRVGT